MARIAMCGAGRMASGMVERLLRTGDQVRVWNRTIERARPLEQMGATVSPEPLDALAGAEFVYIMLNDDASVNALFDRILDVIPNSAAAIDHTTVSPKGTLERFARTERADVTFLSAPLWQSPQGARDGSGIMMVSGPETGFAKIKTHLERMCSDLWYLRERCDKAASFMLFANEL